MKKMAFSVLLVLLSMLIFASCMQSVEFDVNFIVDGEVYETVGTNGSGPIKMPPNPAKDGYDFVGWYWDKDVWERPFTANSLLDEPLSSDMNVYAKWSPVGGGCNHKDSDLNGRCDNCGEIYNSTPNLPINASEGLKYELNFDKASYSVVGIGTCSDTNIFIPYTYNNLPVTGIAKKAFHDCKWLITVTIPDGVTKIGEDAFHDCKELTSVIIPDSVTEIGEKAFHNCGKLSLIMYCGSENEWDAVHKHNRWDDKAGSYTVVYNYNETPSIPDAPSTPSDHTHEYSIQSTDFAYLASPADCLNAVKYYYSCSCGKKGVETFHVGSALGHTEIIDAAIDPTCTITGLTEGKHCSVCKETLIPQRTIMPNGHTEVIDVAIPPTCTNKGLTEGKHCSVCNHIIKAQTVIDFSDHVEVVDVTIAPTCTATGLTEGKHCSVCNEVLVAQEEIAALGHELIDIVAKEPNCTEEGYTAHKACTRCPYTEEKEILPVKHARVDCAGLAPTCVLEGYTDYWYCSKCLETFEFEKLAPVGHTLVDVAAKDATCFTDGYSAHQACSVCSHTVGKVIVPADHTGTWTADGNNEYILCTVCNKKYIREKNVVLDFADNKISAPAVLKPGTEGRLTVTVEDAVIKCIADKEAYDKEAGNPEIYLTNTDADHSIATGGKYLVFEFDVKLGEGTNSTWPAFSIALMDNGGNTMHVIPVATYNNTVKLNGVALDNIAYVADKENGTWMTLRYVVELATEKAEDGNYVSYSTLYYKHRDIDEPMKKAGSTQTKKSTYTGNTGRTDAYRARIVQTGPNYPDQIFWLDNMTFFRTNDSNYLYSACAHELADWQTVSAPTCKADGVYTRKCTVEGCGYVETAYAPAGAHTPGEDVAAKAPTCGVAGHTAYNICSVCETKVGYEVVPATGHDLSAWTDIEGGKQKKTCANGCGYYEIRTVLTDAPVTFDDGTVHDGEKLSFSRDNLTFGEGDVSAVDEWGFAKWSISTTVPGREGQTALRIQTTKANWASGRATNLIVAPTNGGTEGNVYVLDFDFYSENSYYNGTRQILQIYFGGSVTNFDQYKNDLKIGSAVLGTWEQWISLRIVYTVNVNGEATREVFKKDAEGNYVSMGVGTVKNSAIKLDTNIAIGFCSYASEVNRDYYLDNISHTRYTAACEHVVESWTQTKAPACGVDGVEEGTCKWCGATQTRAIDSIDHEYGEWVLVNLPACGVDGVETATCKLCGDVKEKITPRLSEHALSAWADAEEGKESRSCGNEGCGYVQTRAKRNVITFDDGNLTDSDRLVYSANANVTAGATTATSNNDYATISIVAAPGRENDTALRVQTVVAKYNKSYAPTISVPTTDGSTTGNVYTLDFDLYNVTTYNGARAFLQLNFASAAITLNTYRDSVQLSNTYGEAQLGKCETWISVRFVFTVTADGSANYEVFKKGTDGEYVSVKTATLTNSSIKLDACTVSFFNYSAQVDRDYYLDNISLTRTAAAAE